MGIRLTQLSTGLKVEAELGKIMIAIYYLRDHFSVNW